MGKTDSGRPRHLVALGPALKLAHHFVHLAKPRSPDRLAVTEAAAVGIDRKRTTRIGHPFGEQLFLLPRLAKPRFCKVNQLRPAVGVLQLGDLNVTRGKAGLLEGRGRRVNAGAVVRLPLQPR